MRDERIDLLRALGVAMIILAHVTPPAFIFQLRNFDVPLMVLISGMSFGLSYKNESFLNYMWKRVKRLVFPVWIFLTIYFGCILLLGLKIEKITYQMLLQSYFLVGGLGYVWIIKVFLLVALASPTVYHYNKTTENTNAYLICILAMFVLYEIIRILVEPYFSAGIAKSITLISHYIIHYSLVFAIGLRMSVMNRRAVVLCATTSFLIFAGLWSYFWWLEGNIVFTQAHKYPPTIYYFSYAICICCIAWLLISHIERVINHFRIFKKLIMFIAGNSIWVYLWHIPLLKLIHTGALVKYILVILLATLGTFIQVWIVRNILIKYVSHEENKRNLKMILTG